MQDIVVTFDDAAAFWGATCTQWFATEGDFDLDCTVGFGKTPLDAIIDLLDQLQ